jgi:RNA polymerase sigma-70 factor (ECF subfamily)
MDSAEQIQRDRLLRGAVLAGDERAWRTWYEETYDDLYAYVLWRCGGNKDQTEDVVQEIWLTAVRRVRKFDPRRGSFLAWLRGIAANVLRNHFRRLRPARRLQSLDEEPSATDSTEVQRTERERAHAVATTLAALPGRHEDVLRAKYLDGASVQQIARSSGQTQKAVESLLTRARQSFREQYGKLTVDREDGAPLKKGHSTLL